MNEIILTGNTTLGTTPPVKEFDDITVALSYIKQFALAHDDSPVMFARAGDKFRVVCDATVKTI